MFTGIVEEKGTVRRVVDGSQWGSLLIGAREVLRGTKTGDSIAVNGVCLTVTALTGEGFSADVMGETMRRTNLGALSAGDAVNLERAMAADGRFGGHIVTGHIDGTGRIAELRREGNAVWVCVAAEPQLLGLIVEKGSVAIDGISLTVARTGKTEFWVSVIPHTGAETTLLSGRPGKTVNLETDIIGKYVSRLLGAGGFCGGTDTAAGPGAGIEPAADIRTDAEHRQGRPGGGLSEEFLRSNGF